LVDAGKQCYPADPTQGQQVVLDQDGKFEQRLAGPKIVPDASGELPPASAFAILSLLPTWNGKGEPQPVSGFLGYDEDKFALFDPKASTSWEKTCAWIASQEFAGIAPLGPKPKAGGLRIPAPGPGDAASQNGPLAFEEHILDTIAWEGEVPHLYLDSRGYMTVGIGICLVTKEKRTDPTRALTLPFKNLETGKPASETEIRAAFDKIVVMPPKLEAAKYETHPRLELEEKYMRQMVRDFIDGKALPALKGNFPEWESFPKCARRALLDIAYNCGPAFFDDHKPKQPAKAPKLRAAVLAKKWDVAAAEVPQGGRAERRQWRTDLLTFAHRLGGGKLAPVS
jgi:GH24 family phage-related lysozyme (muramidase)